jgi:ubiquinone/menaquinone biosynthesis C-methylase UbiE
MFELKKFYQPGFNPQQFWDEKYAAAFSAGTDADQFRRQGFWPILQKYLKPDGRYLDAGCGVGGWALFLHDEGFNVAGIDTARRTIQAMSEYAPDVELKVAPVTAIPYADNSFDGVIAIGTLEYLQGQTGQALAQMHRVAKPGSFIFIEVAYANLLRRLTYIPLKRLQYALKASKGEEGTFAHYLYSRADVQALLEDAGFELVETHPHDLPDADSHYGLYVDWPALRGSAPYKLNAIGRLKKMILNSLSPWIAATGMVVVAQKK